jgi:hypothetical protein
VSKLICYAYDGLGYELTCGEVACTKEHQALYLKDGKAQTMHSKYMNRRAVDLNLFIDGHYQSSVEAYKPLAVYWVKLDPEQHVWGGNWTALWDAVHLEYEGEERAMRYEKRHAAVEKPRRRPDTCLKSPVRELGPASRPLHASLR